MRRIHVSSGDGIWQVAGDQADEPPKKHGSRAVALLEALKLAVSKPPATVVLHRLDGTVDKELEPPAPASRA